MKSTQLSIAAKFCLIFFSYIIIYYTYQAFTKSPFEGDSIAYHIPIAHSILNGSIITLSPPPTLMHYYPSNGELFLAFMMLFHIPLNLFNVIGIFLLFYFCKKLAERFLSKDISLIFALSIATLPVILRWIESQVIDVYTAVFFLASLFILQKPEKKASYFLKLGICLGLLLGVKNTGPLFAIILLFFYGKSLLQFINFNRFIIFLFPVTVFGFSWYIRNILLTGNPFYPQSLPFFPGDPSWNIFKWNVLEITIQKPFSMTNAFFGEYGLWSFSIVLPFFIFYFRKKISPEVMKLLYIGSLNLFIYLFLPTSPQYNIMVSSFRYSYPVFITLFLFLFIVLSNYKTEYILVLLLFVQLITLPSFSYHPKLLFIVFPIALYIFKPIDVRKLNIHLQQIIPSRRKKSRPMLSSIKATRRR